jgi:hypothetical protein
LQAPYNGGWSGITNYEEIEPFSVVRYQRKRIEDGDRVADQA